MANSFYPAGREAFASAGVNWVSDTIRVQFVSAGYVYSSAHTSLADIPAGAREGDPAALASKTATGGVLDAADVTVPAVTGDVIVAVVIYKWTGVEATSTLLFYLDAGSGLPRTPDGNAIELRFDNGANKIYAF